MITEFEKAGMKMEMKSDAMGDAMSGLGGNVDEEADNIYNQICEEQGISQMESAGTVGTGVV